MQHDACEKETRKYQLQCHAVAVDDEGDDEDGDTDDDDDDGPKRWTNMY